MFLFFSRAKGILGMNARNLLYIARYNSEASKKFADDKIYTKKFLSSRGIGCAKLYTVISSHQELRFFDPATLPQRFVIKPNHGFGGEGIIVITGKDDEVFYGKQEKKWSWKDLQQALSAILDGKYAISGLRDEVIIEELLVAHPDFRRLSGMGLPDIRVIVFNYVPVIAMLRLPTTESEGKANLHLGAVGLGIDLASGKTTHGVRHDQFISKLPNGDPVNSIEIPEWDTVLHVAATCQKVSGIGYLAVDVAITETGVKVLELNARAGLAVQIANRVLLRSRLDKVADLTVLTPDNGVQIGKMLFSHPATLRSEDTKKDMPTIGLYETVRISHATPETLIAKIDPHIDDAIIDETVRLPADEKTLSIQLKGQKLVLPFKKGQLARNTFQVIIGKRGLSGFLIDTTHSTPHASSGHITKEEKIIANADRKLAELVSRIHLLAYFKPQNLDQARSDFFSQPLSSPQFIYRPLPEELGEIERELAKIPTDFDHPLARLYIERIREIQKQIVLLRGRATESFTQLSVDLYGDITEYECDRAGRFLQTEHAEKDTSDIVPTAYIESEVKDYFLRHHLDGWKVVLQDSAMADMQVSKAGILFVNKKARITHNRLSSQIAHEIETHIYRNENGKRQPYRIFEHGTCGYLETEEGLAIYNQRKLGIPLGEKLYWPAWRIIALHYGKNMGFAELFHFLIATYGLTQETAWHTCVRVKRGLRDTSKSGVFMKDRIYFSGYHKVSQYIEYRGKEGCEKLYMGKVRVEDIPMLERHEGLQWKARHLPSWYYQ